MCILCSSHYALLPTSNPLPDICKLILTSYNIVHTAEGLRAQTFKESCFIFIVPLALTLIGTFLSRCE